MINNWPQHRLHEQINQAHAAATLLVEPPQSSGKNSAKPLLLDGLTNQTTNGSHKYTSWCGARRCRRYTQGTKNATSTAPPKAEGIISGKYAAFGHIINLKPSVTELGIKWMHRQSMKVTLSFCLKSKWEALQSYTKEISYQWAQTGVHTEPPAPLAKSHQWKLGLIPSLRLRTPVRTSMRRGWEHGITSIKPTSGRCGCQIDFNCSKKIKIKTLIQQWRVLIHPQLRTEMGEHFVPDTI